MYGRRLPWLSLLAVVWAGSCSGGGDRSGVPDAGSRSYARVRVAITLPRQGDVGVATEARLMRYRDLDVETAEILTGLAVQGADPRLAPGRCVQVDREALLDEALGRASPDAAVQLLDAGEMVLRAAGRTVPVVPRYVPEIVPALVSGVVYSLDSAALDDGVGAAAMEGDDVYLSAFGGEDVGRFDTVAALPAAARLQAVGGQDLSAGDAPAVDRGADLEVRWTVDGARAPADGEGVTVVLAWSDAGRGEIRCRADEPGRLVVPRALLAGVPEEASLSLAVERSARAPFTAAGLDGGELEVSVRDVIAVR